jgi:pyrimidine 5'-nucleotidase
MFVHLLSRILIKIVTIAGGITSILNLGTQPRVPYNCRVFYTTLFFDLDETLYPSSTGVWAAIRERMNQYMLDRLRMPPEEVAALRRHYFETYGTTLRGLQIHNQVDADEFLAYVHDLPIEKMVSPDPELRDLLLALKLSKFIFTNADVAHANRILSALGMQECFNGIIDVRALDFYCKPDPMAYQIALSLSGETSPQRCIYLDDSPRNLAPAHNLGMYTILIGEEKVSSSANRSLRRPHDLRLAMPELWQDNHDDHDR